LRSPGLEKRTQNRSIGVDAIACSEKALRWQPQIAPDEGNNFYDLLRRHKFAANCTRRERRDEQVSMDH
jgi:hypothetical protein